ncbi:MAG TPA: hypothetical protein VGP17_12330 [Solirubrobacteraceae bacterium]|jgi:hypothetical protein|nr:hypothetical protein [Solirubrobacteraceae bacterium]
MLRYAMAVVGVPLVMWVLCLGCGLAVERLLRVRLANALVPLLGLCAALIVIFPGYALGVGDGLAICLIAVLTLLGLLLARGGLRARINPGWAGLAGLGIYAIYMLPVIAYGHWTWSGYDFVNDTAFEMLLADHIKTFGTTLGNMPESTTRDFVSAYLSTGYPLGSQALLGTLSAITGTDVAVLYQGFISTLAAFGAIALATLTRGFLDARRAALAGFAAMAANLTYQYALQGNIKEIGLAATICIMLALAAEAMRISKPYTGAVLIAIPSAAAMLIYNVVALPYIGAFVLFLGIGLILARRRLPTTGWARPVCAGVIAIAALSVPILGKFSTFFQVAHAGQGSTGAGATAIGQLLRKLPISQISGVWLSGEYRVAIASHHAGLLTAIATTVILLAIVPAVAYALWRKEPMLLAVAGMVGLVLLIVFPRASPYAQGKLIAMSSPFVVLIALVGLLSIRRGRLGLLGLGSTAVLCVGILASDALAYAHDRVAPTAQIEAMSAVAKRFAGQGLVFWNENEEYSKYFARETRIDSPYEPYTPFQVQPLSPISFYGRYFDLDEQAFASIDRFPIIVMRRSPSASRPPANYRLAYENTYYQAWRRTAGPVVLAHLPLQRTYSSSEPVPCAALRSMVKGAPKGAQLTLAIAPEEAFFEVASDKRRWGTWPASAEQPGGVVTDTGGHAEGSVQVRRAGNYTVWVQGDFPRPVQAEVDHRIVGSVSGTNTHGEWLQAGTVRLSAGSHVLGVTKGSGHMYFGPGEWGVGAIGAVAIRATQPERLQSIPLSRYTSICGVQADWVELIQR